jgi:hypothetical protein
MPNDGSRAALAHHTIQDTRPAEPRPHAERIYCGLPDCGLNRGQSWCADCDKARAVPPPESPRALELFGEGARAALGKVRPHADPYAIDATKCAKCGSGEFHVQVLAWATFEGGTFVAFEYDEEVIPERPSWARCAECGTERVIEP